MDVIIGFTLLGIVGLAFIIVGINSDYGGGIAIVGILLLIMLIGSYIDYNTTPTQEQCTCVVTLTSTPEPTPTTQKRGWGNTLLTQTPEVK